MLYKRGSFSVPATSGAGTKSTATAAAVCATGGHMDPDVRGKCMRCGEKILAAPAVESRHVATHIDLLAKP